MKNKLIKALVDSFLCALLSVIAICLLLGTICFSFYISGKLFNTEEYGFLIMFLIVCLTVGFFSSLLEGEI